MTFIPKSLVDFVTHFESSSFSASNPFYYEESTNTINFGYGINLTSAENLALANNATTKNYLYQWLSANGIQADSSTVLGTPWTSLSTLNSSNGDALANSLNAALTPGNYGAAANSLLNSFLTIIVASKLVANVPNFNSLPVTTQWALEAMYYNGSGTLGPITYNAAKSGNLVGIALQLAFIASR